MRLCLQQYENIMWIVNNVNNDSSVQSEPASHVHKLMFFSKTYVCTLIYLYIVFLAGGEQMEGCVMSCNTSAYGCCPDGETPAHGPEFEGCCLQYVFGCCPDNYRPAEGPHLEGNWEKSLKLTNSCSAMKYNMAYVVHVSWYRLRLWIRSLRMLSG